MCNVCVLFVCFVIALWWFVHPCVSLSSLFDLFDLPVCSLLLVGLCLLCGIFVLVFGLVLECRSGGTVGG